MRGVGIVLGRRTGERKTPSRAIVRMACLAVVIGLSSMAWGQGHGGGPGGGGGGGMGGIGGGMGGSRGPLGSGYPGMGGRNGSPPLAGQPTSSSAGDSTMRGGLQLGPPGRWWDDGEFAKSLGLDTKQQRRMDEVFSSNKGTLLKLYRNLVQEESQLEKTTRGRTLDEEQIFQQIDRVSQARGELEKANAHMLLQIRKEMTTEQAARLDEHRAVQP